MRNGSARNIALGGVFAAAALTIMMLGGIIPVATYITPMLCCLMCNIIYVLCGKVIAWVWYVVVALLSLLMGPDKEASAVFLFLGYYPILKPWFDRLRFALLAKMLFFNAAIGLLYSFAIYLFGFDQIAEEFKEVGILGAIITFILGSFTFFLLDTLLNRFRWNGKNEVK